MLISPTYKKEAGLVDSNETFCYRFHAADAFRGQKEIVFVFLLPCMKYRCLISGIGKYVHLRVALAIHPP